MTKLTNMAHLCINPGSKEIPRKNANFVPVPGNYWQIFCKYVRSICISQNFEKY